ncbi:fatty acyl-AMP ligase [Crenalkalicoccus roseus]|uniref:fatty acyl-AMP ligase n=1 Tax=Crenalkalicoccus roseus TaxID=1485588 RepID=UPI001F017CE9|nr:fatty acyl-AMP ligase [Crenalkalicoccus roseus]
MTALDTASPDILPLPRGSGAPVTIAASTPTWSALPLRPAGFGCLAEALDYAARGASGLNFYGAAGRLEAVLTYAELRRRALAGAARLAGFGLARGDRIGLIAAASPDFVAAFMACQYAGLVPVPLPGPGAFSDRAAHLDQIRRQLAQCGARRVILPASLARAWRGGEEGEIPWESWTALLERPAAPPGAPLGPGELCYLQYSSGSTRFPTGVAVTQQALMANCHAIAHALRLREDDRIASWLPLHHDMGLVGILLGGLSCQRSVDLMASEDFARRPATWLRLIARNRATISSAPCFGYELCSRRATRELVAELDLSHWRVAGIGGEMIRPEAIAAFTETFAPAGFRPRAMLPCYGLAEATLAVSIAPLGEGLALDRVERQALAEEGRALPVVEGGRALVRCGRPVQGCEVTIQDEAGRVLGERRVGRIMVRGPSVMTGYFGDDAATARVLGPDGWLDTGDRGYWAGEELVVIGRAKDSIIVNGRNIWPQDLEWAVERLPGLRAQDCAAFAVEGAEGERPVLLVQCRSQDPAERQALVAAARQAVLRACGVECEVVPVPPRSLPRTSSGKLSRTRARANYLAGLYQGQAGQPRAGA